MRCVQVYGYIQTRLVGSKEAGQSIQVGGQEVKLGIPQVEEHTSLTAIWKLQ